MSFEGYYQYLTDKGHYFTMDVYDPFDKEFVVKDLYPGEVIVWSNLVDVTNGSFDENGNRIDGYVKLERLSVEEFDICPLCNVAKRTEIVYEIPKNKGRKVNADIPPK